MKNAPEYAPMEPVISESVRPFPGVRWVVRGTQQVLQQRHEITTYTNNSPSALKYMWRDVLIEVEPPDQP